MDFRQALAVSLLLVTGCGMDTGQQFTLQLFHHGVQRTARVHLPDAFDERTPTGVVLNFHGASSNADQQADYSGLERAASRHGLVAVHPQGLFATWNAGKCCGGAMVAGVDDVGFVDALLDKLAERVMLDRRRVYAMGISNGGMFTYRLACERADTFAAVAVVAGVNPDPGCTPSRPVSLLHFHGTSDLLVPYNGSPLLQGAEKSVSRWAETLGCTDPARQTHHLGDVTCKTRGPCNRGSETVLCTVQGGGHTWPGGQDIPFLGPVTHDMDATEEALEFFARHPMP